jgi:hypothetical protein
MSESKIKTFRCKILDGDNEGCTRLIVTAPNPAKMADAVDNLKGIVLESVIEKLFDATRIEIIGEDQADPLWDNIIQWDQICFDE